MTLERFFFSVHKSLWLSKNPEDSLRELLDNWIIS